MRFTDRRKKLSTRRWNSTGTPAEIETFESRLLLTTVPNILTPTGTVTDATPEFTWEAVDNAESYDLWVTSLVSYETLFVATDIPDTRYTPAEGSLGLGKIRVWARANLAGGGTSAWSPSQDAVIQSAPTITGPVGTGSTNLISDTSPEITWNSATLADRYQIWVTDLTKQAAAQEAAGDNPVDVSLHSTVYTVLNQEPVLDADGNQLTDSAGNPLFQEVRSFVLPTDPNPNATERTDLELPLSRYRIWMRSQDDVGTFSAWSTGFTFDIGPTPENLGPTAPTFQESPRLLFDAVDGATHYEVYVAKDGTPGAFFRRTVAATSTISESVRIVQSVAGPPIVENSNAITEPHETARLDEDGLEVPFIIPDGSYSFWVRAISNPDAGPLVRGVWSGPAKFETLAPPTINDLTTVGGVVTAGKPTIEWSVIDGASRYEVQINKFNSRPPFLSTMVSDTKYTFQETIPRGEYTVWVRPISERGEFGPWSAAKQFTATGGRPVVNVPNAGDTQLFPSFEWSAVTDDTVTGYEVFVSHVGVDFTFINVTVTETSYAGVNPLDDGNYRVWIRAVFADGTFGQWSDPVDFIGGVAGNDNLPAEPETLTASVEVRVLPTLTTNPPEVVETAQITREQPPVDEEEVVVDDESAVRLPMENIPESLISELAQNCADAEWWDAGVSQK